MHDTCTDSDLCRALSRHPSLPSKVAFFLQSRRTHRVCLAIRPRGAAVPVPRHGGERRPSTSGLLLARLARAFLSRTASRWARTLWRPPRTSLISRSYLAHISLISRLQVARISLYFSGPPNPPGVSQPGGHAGRPLQFRGKYVRK